ncbi:biotin--[acetyl-CoA-carboxylase] ligase [Ramlibacter sp. Leaf400]|uniref:biotin--[acetyl-CoA-carboxylase] ligase n=1 Tax=Ramlibacter sp. Leaf400 TaxID=1736365 RepID=UPI0006F5AB89|nr:biotin--[acetyl-CoA-carboxylase] ligase [Ramlibacter sp. Leaf400]KQT12352.1 biotin--acetyl-CoA-carboxylase ligase [Ramlibacter sp. Leaf400]
MRWPAEAVWEQVAPLLPGFSVEVLPEVGSTNTELMGRARAGRLDPVLLVAERQSAGRGRLGRQWHGEAGASLTFSLGLVLAPADWSGLSLAVGATLAEALHGDIRLKWPNDLWVGDRKLAGILIETAASPDGGGRYCIVGVGINLATPAGEGYATPPIGLRELASGAEAGEVLLRLADPLVRTLQAFEQFGFAPFRARFAARDALADRAVRLSDGTAGTAHGVDEQGALLVHTAAGMKAVASAEVSVRPAGSPLP